ncbi:pectinesterase inhibitor 3-like [Bidens hawaiensis]|uniref:pectinesterase inhibitor 3-like n=1 Tax=Bidens hawaiensis TaxID=980011 RepID=UPI00404B12F6
MAATFIFLIILTLASFTTTIVTATPPTDLVQSSCLHATFPKVCIHTFSLYKGPATTPRELAQAAIKVSITRATKASEYLSGLQKEADRREKGALKDCASQIADSVDDLRKTLGELKELKRGTFKWQMSNAKTWVSAALTNEDTCLDGFKEIEGRVRSDIKRKVTNVAKVTSNALYLINRLDHP